VCVLLEKKMPLSADIFYGSSFPVMSSGFRTLETSGRSDNRHNLADSLTLGTVGHGGKGGTQP
jgi:hypothetical protein